MRPTPDPDSDKTISDMTDEPTDDTNDDVASIEAELNTVLAGKNPLANLRVVQTGPVHYTVLSARNGSATTQRVDLQNGECSCSDMTYNKNLNTESDEGREVCAHYAAAALEHPQLTPEGAAAYQHMGVLDETERVLAKLEAEHRSLKNIAEAAGEAKNLAENATAGATDTPESGESEPSDAEPDAGAQEEAERLQEAFDEVLDDMQVKALNGIVWFQTGRDTPDAWPFPGGDETFDVITSPDSVMYVHDGSADWADGPHKHFDDKPGEWWKNALEPEDVDDYIAEVLE